jgi:hypothetical protein
MKETVRFNRNQNAEIYVTGQTGSNIGVKVNTELYLNMSDMPSLQLGSKRPKKIIVDRTTVQANFIVALDCIAFFISTFKSKGIKLGKIIIIN